MLYLLAITGGHHSRIGNLKNLFHLFSETGAIGQLLLLLGFLLLTATGTLLIGSSLLLIGYLIPDNDRKGMNIIDIGPIKIRANARGWMMAGGLILITAAAGYSVFGSPLGKSAGIPTIHDDAIEKHDLIEKICALSPADPLCVTKKLEAPKN